MISDKIEIIFLTFTIIFNKNIVTSVCGGGGGGGGGCYVLFSCFAIKM